MTVPKLWYLDLWGLFSNNFHFEECFLLILASLSFFSISTTAAFTSQHQILSQDFHGSAIMKTKDNKNMKKSDYCVTPGCVRGGLISEDSFNLAPSYKKVSNHYPSSTKSTKILDWPASLILVPTPILIPWSNILFCLPVGVTKPLFKISNL